MHAMKILRCVGKAQKSTTVPNLLQLAKIRNARKIAMPSVQ